MAKCENEPLNYLLLQSAFPAQDAEITGTRRCEGYSASWNTFRVVLLLQSESLLGLAAWIAGAMAPLPMGCLH